MPRSLGIIASSVMVSNNVVFKNYVAQGWNNVNSTTLVLTTSQQVDIGDTVFVAIATDNLTANTPMPAVTDSAGNSWSMYCVGGVGATAGTGVIGAIVATIATKTIPSGGTITITLDGSVTAKGAVVLSYTNCILTLRTGTWAGASNVAGGVTTPSAQVGDLLIGMCAQEHASMPIDGAAADSSLGSAWTVYWSQSGGGTANAGVRVIFQSKVPTIAGTQNFSYPTAPYTDYLWIAAVFQHK